jgi:hypothetical protein
MHPGVVHLLKQFEFGHLPPHLQNISSPFYALAHTMAADLPDNPEKTVGLRKLLEAKDCCVRALVTG